VRFTPSIYKELVIPRDLPFSDKLLWAPSLGKSVTFEPNLNLPVHSWFYYKQGFSKELVEWLAKRYRIQQGSVILDPFCGVGTTMTTAKEMGLSSIGVDILPLCVFVSKTKLQTEYNQERLRKEAKLILSGNPKKPKSEWPKAWIVPRALNEKVRKELLFYKERVDTIQDDPIKNLLLLCLLNVVDKVSYTKKDGGFLRIVTDKRIPDTRQALRDEIERIVGETTQTKLSGSPVTGMSQVIIGDARSLSIGDESIDFVVTSPPYLNKTDYTRLFSLELYLAFCKTFEELRKIRHCSIRSHVEAKPIHSRTKVELPSLLLTQLEELGRRPLNNPLTPYMVKGYFEDMYCAISELYRVSKAGAIATYVVWNSSFAGVEFPVDLICSEIAAGLGFQVREILVASMKGVSAQHVLNHGETALRHSIIVLQK
jgi:DNA modification methylase